MPKTKYKRSLRVDDDFKSYINFKRIISVNKKLIPSISPPIVASDICPKANGPYARNLFCFILYTFEIRCQIGITLPA
jgi:hypothetical protein